MHFTNVIVLLGLSASALSATIPLVGRDYNAIIADLGNIRTGVQSLTKKTLAFPDVGGSLLQALVCYKSLYFEVTTS